MFFILENTYSILTYVNKNCILKVSVGKVGFDPKNMGIKHII